MARSSITGVDRADQQAPGRGADSLGPSDSSDSGSDTVGVADDSDPGVPVDVALRDDQAAPLPLGESLAASEGDTGVRDGADIGVDRVFTPGAPDDTEDDADAALNLAGEAAQPSPDEDEQPADPDGSGSAERRPGRDPG